MSSLLLPQSRRELAYRVSGGTEFTLYWSADDGTTSVEIHQPESDVTLEFAVPRELALRASSVVARRNGDAVVSSEVAMPPR